MSSYGGTVAILCAGIVFDKSAGAFRDRRAYPAGEIEKEKGATPAGSRSASTNSNANTRERANAAGRRTRNSGSTYGKESSYQKARAFRGAT